ncbi:MAG: tetratricopeptide repeat protein, partial [Alphaproteobacteria bacterium]
ITLAPDLAEAHGRAGVVLEALGRQEEAEASLRQAAALDPEYGEWQGRLGALLLDRGRDDEALVRFDRAIALKAVDAGLLINRGTLLGDRGRYDEAMSDLRQACDLAPDRPEAYMAMGKVHGKQHLAEAEACFRRVVELWPEHAEAHYNIGNALWLQGAFAEAIASFRRAIDIKPDFLTARVNLIYSLDTDPAQSLADQQAERRAFHQFHIAHGVVAAQSHDNHPDPDRPIRIGYVSSDFRDHSAAFVMGPVLFNHDRDRFIVHCYSGVAVEDKMTERFRSRASVWRRTETLSDQALADLIRADGIDILVDLSGYTSSCRLLVFARKPAPVQVTAWGCAHGTGLSTVDAFFADPVYIPPEDRHLFAESIIDLPSFMPFWTPDSAPAVAPPPALKAGHITFGCFNRITKITPQAIALWAEILNVVTGSRFLVKDSMLDDIPSHRQRIETLFAGHGVDTSRLGLLGRTGHVDHLAAYGRVDIGLDPFPQNGGVSTLEALWMGVPVVALMGTTPTGRASAAINTGIGLDRFVAATPEAYRDIAIAAASDLAGLADLRGSLRRRVATSPFGDHARYVRAAEDAYRTLWRRWCAGRGR